MYLALIGIAFFLILTLIAIRLAWGKREPAVPNEEELIHKSGIFSVVRQSPRVNVYDYKPKEEEICQYLADTNVDIHGNTLLEADKQRLRKMWNNHLEASIRVVEQGDTKGVDFYYYDFEAEDPICADFVRKGHFVTREEIYKHPRLLPPFHVGCHCRLAGYHGTSEELRDTTKSTISPLFTDGECPPLPDWHTVLKPA
ncbi:MAG: hypothetical protein GF344_10890 [Chitinivibrionales bacterium]|nr:hypothetical protein [Chitinivibrionales bacterium]MBD3357309.1 hypothetical protein [Chitinivibrionales bacterium]